MKQSPKAVLLVVLTIAVLVPVLGCQPPATEEPAAPAAAESEREPKLIAHDLSHPGYTRGLEQGAPIAGEYTMEIQVGTPPQTFEVVMDSGSSNLILKGDSSICDNCGSEPGKNYSPGSSSTSQDNNKTYQIQYGSGSLDATEYSDTVGLPGQEGFSYTFGVMTHDAGVPNILGMAYKSLAEPQDSPLTPWFDTLVSRTGIADEFSMLMCGPEKGGKIELGGHSVEPTAYMEVTKEAWYVVEPDILRVKGSDTSLGSFQGVQTIVDSGTTELVVPEDMYEGIIDAVDQAATAAGLKLVRIQGGGIGVEGEPSEFSKLPTFQVVAGDNTFDIAPSTYMMLVGHDQGEPVYMVGVSAQNQAILGQVFMSNFYTVFDRESTPNRVGFTPVGDLCD